MRKDSLSYGNIFGRLKVLKYSYSSVRKNGKAGERIMLCLCDCGKKVEIRTSNLNSGNTKSCGCYHSDMTTESNIKRSVS